ncbi:MAG: hypothetical protein J6L77_07695 [Coprococcus sp.]|nr:hypothetical protein [Coprococcus sp.]
MKKWTKFRKKLKKKIGEDRQHIFFIVILLLAVLFFTISMPDIYGGLNERQRLGNINVVDEDYSDEKVNSNLSFVKKVDILNADDITFRRIYSEPDYPDFVKDNPEIIEGLKALILSLKQQGITGMDMDDKQMESAFIYATYAAFSKQSVPLETFYVWYVKFSTEDFTYNILFDANDFTAYKVSIESVVSKQYILTEDFTTGMDLSDAHTLFGDQGFMNLYYRNRLMKLYEARNCYVDYTYGTGAKLYITYWENGETTALPCYFELAVGDGGYAAFNMMIGNKTSEIVSKISIDIYSTDAENMNDTY